MGVVAVWQCDRDGRMFQDKKAAEEYDKMLELAEALSELLTRAVPGLSSEQAEAAGIALAERREQLGKACKGQVSALAAPAEPAEASAPEAVPQGGGKVAPLANNKRKSGSGG